MTVCIASLCAGGLVAIADRMMTLGEIATYERPLSKIYLLPSFDILIMTAADMVFQDEILNEIFPKFYENGQVLINRYSVADIAKMYSEIAHEIHNRNEVDSKLARFGLTRETFISRQSEMQESFISQITDKVLSAEPPPVSAIIAGFQKGVGEIFFFREGKLSPVKRVNGFVAVGNGAWHAETKLLELGHFGAWGITDAIFNCYAAKKAAETALGVGKETQVLYYDKDACHLVSRDSAQMKALENLYKKLEKGEKTLRSSIYKKFYEQFTKEKVKW